MIIPFFAPKNQELLNRMVGLNEPHTCWVGDVLYKKERHHKNCYSITHKMLTTQGKVKQNSVVFWSLAPSSLSRAASELLFCKDSVTALEQLSSFLRSPSRAAAFLTQKKEAASDVAQGENGHGVLDIFQEHHNRMAHEIIDD